MSNMMSPVEPIEVPTPIYEPNHEPLEDDYREVQQIDAASNIGSNNEPFGSGNESSAAKKGDSGTTTFCGIALIFICLILQIIIFVLSVIGTPLDIFRNKSPNSYIPDSHQRACFSMWGYKRCGPRRNLKGFDVRGIAVEVNIDLPTSGYVCDGYKSRLSASSAFAIISIVAALATLVLVVLVMCKILRGFIVGIVGIVTMVMLLICWAILVGVFYKSCVWTNYTPGLVIVDRTQRMKDEYNYGAGFGIILAAFGVQFVNAILLFFVDKKDDEDDD